MVSLALLSLPMSWHSYQDSVNGREKLPDWEQLWSDLYLADGAAERATVQESQDIAELASCSNVRDTGVLHQCRMAQRCVQWCDMQGVVAVVQRSIEGALVSDRGSFSIGSVSSLAGMLEVGWISYLLLSN